MPGPPSYNADRPKNVQDILEPCSSDYLQCDGGTDCLDQFGRCSIDRLSDKTVTEGVLPPELTDSNAVESREGDAELPKTLLECILTHQRCIVPNEKGCMAEYQRCSLRALQDSRNRRISSHPNYDDENIVIGRENEFGPSIGDNNNDDNAFSKFLSRNFTLCVSLYTDCVAFYGDNVAGDGDECAETFDQCSIALLFEFNLNGTDSVSSSPLGQDALDGVLDGDRRLATELYECIRDNMMCLMGASRNVCMGDYQACSLAAMDRAKEDKRRRKGDKNKPPSGDNNNNQKQSSSKNDWNLNINEVVPPISHEGREDPNGLYEPPSVVVVPGIIPPPGPSVDGPHYREDESGFGPPRDAAGRPINVGQFEVVQSRENEPHGKMFCLQRRYFNYLWRKL